MEYHIGEGKYDGECESDTVNVGGNVYHSSTIAPN